MLIARCKRLKSRSILIGRTVFKFDGDGLSQTKDVGNARYDFDVLVKRNGVEAVGPQKVATAANPYKPTPTAQRSAVTLTTITEKYEEANKPQPIVRPKRKPAVAPPAVVKATPTLKPIPTSVKAAPAIPPANATTEASDNFLGNSVEETIDFETGEVFSEPTSKTVVADSDEDTNPEVPAAKKKVSRRKFAKAKSSAKKEEKPKRRRVTKRKKKSDD